RVGLRHGRSTALFNLGWVHALLGEYQQAITDLDEALTLRAEDDFEGQAAGWHSLGYAHHHLGHYPEAIACYWRSIDNCREAGIPIYEALALSDLGETYLASGEPALARLQWQYAVTALDKLQHPAAAGIRARLAAT